MATTRKTETNWVKEARARALAQLPKTEEERARRLAEIERALANRDARPSIAPDTAGDYIRAIRDEQSEAR